MAAWSAAWLRVSCWRLCGRNGMSERSARRVSARRDWVASFSFNLIQVTEGYVSKQHTDLCMEITN